MSFADDPEARRLSKLQASFAEADRLAIDDSIKLLLERKEGRLFLWWTLQLGKVMTQPFSTDPALTAFQCGELNVGNQLLARIIQVDPAGFMKMQQESMDANRERTAKLNDAHGTGDDDDTGNADWNDGASD